jgi:osmotically-inducible protein OsmY
MPNERLKVPVGEAICEESLPALGKTRDDRIAVEASLRLKSLGFPELRGIQCTCKNGILTLRGRISSYHSKQLAQEALRSLKGLKYIVNVAEVRLS